MSQKFSASDDEMNNDEFDRKVDRNYMSSRASQVIRDEDSIIVMNGGFSALKPITEEASTLSPALKKRKSSALVPFVVKRTSSSPSKGARSPILASSSASMNRPMDEGEPSFWTAVMSTPNREGPDGVFENLREKAARQHCELEEFRGLWYDDFKQYVKRKEKLFIKGMQFRREKAVKKVAKINCYKNILDEIVAELTRDISEIDRSILYLGGFADGLPDKMFEFRGK